MRKKYGRSENTYCAAQRLTNIEVIALSAVLLWNRLFWFNFFPCSGMTPKGQTVQGERVLLKLGIWRDDPIFLNTFFPIKYFGDLISQQISVGTILSKFFTSVVYLNSFWNNVVVPSANFCLSSVFRLNSSTFLHFNLVYFCEFGFLLKKLIFLTLFFFNIFKSS